MITSHVRRSISIIIDGPMDEVHSIAHAVMMDLPMRHSTKTLRYRIESREDLLDENGEIVAPEDIRAALMGRA